MCKSQTRTYRCGCMSRHRLSSCRNKTGQCQGSSYDDIAINSEEMCDICLKGDVMKTLFKERSHARQDALRRGEPTVAVYERFGRARMAIQAAVPRDEPWDGKPLSRPERKWQPPRSSPLKKELRMEGEEEVKDAMNAELLARSKAAVEPTAAV